MTIWRIILKPASRNNTDSHEFCLKNNIVGVGWRISEETRSVNWEEYYSEASKIYNNKKKKRSWNSALNVFKHRMKINDLIWTRDRQNNYYLGRISSDWIYQSEKNNLKTDIINTRKCEWVKIGTVDSVPGKLVNSFIGGKTVQAVNSDSIEIYSKAKYNELRKKDFYDIDWKKTDDIFSLLSSDDCEDLIGIYLQIEKNYYLIPSSCKSDMMRYEFELKDLKTSQSAVVQVKNGDVNLNSNDYCNLDCQVYLFTTKGKYLGEKKDNIYFIEQKEILDFMKKYKDILPNKIRFWMDKLKNN